MESEGERRVIMERKGARGIKLAERRRERSAGGNAHERVTRSGLTKRGKKGREEVKVGGETVTTGRRGGGMEAVRRRAPDGRHLEGRQTCAKSCTARSGP